MYSILSSLWILTPQPKTYPARSSWFCDRGDFYLKTTDAVGKEKDDSLFWNETKRQSNPTEKQIARKFTNNSD